MNTNECLNMFYHQPCAARLVFDPERSHSYIASTPWRSIRSLKPEPRPQSHTQAPVSLWMCFTFRPPANKLPMLKQEILEYTDWKCHRCKRNTSIHIQAAKEHNRNETMRVLWVLVDNEEINEINRMMNWASILPPNWLHQSLLFRDEISSRNFKHGQLPLPIKCAAKGKFRSISSWNVILCLGSGTGIRKKESAGKGINGVGHTFNGFCEWCKWRAANHTTQKKKLNHNSSPNIIQH